MKGLQGFQKGHTINKGKKYSIEHRKHIGLSRLGYKPTKKNIKKLSLSHIGNKHSDKTKEKIKKSTLGKPKPWLLGRPTWNKGKKVPQTSGERNPRWRGGITSENHKIRTSLELKLWRKACLERDNFTCQKYGSIGKDIQVHHINNFADFPELRTTISNGITLSKKAHKEFHKKFGHQNNTLEQLTLYLYGKQ